MTTNTTTQSATTRIVGQIEAAAQQIEAAALQAAEQISEAQTRLMDAGARLKATLEAGQLIAGTYLEGLLADLEAMVPSEPEPTPTSVSEPLTPLQECCAVLGIDPPEAVQQPAVESSGLVVQPEGIGGFAAGSEVLRVEAELMKHPASWEGLSPVETVHEESVSTAALPPVSETPEPPLYPVALPVSESSEPVPEVTADSTEEACQNEGVWALPELPKQWKASRMSLDDLINLLRSRGGAAPDSATKADVLRLLGYNV